jgi:ankyrin repeat protein
MPNRVGANGARIIPGNSEASRLYLVLAGRLGVQMPPAGPLSAAQIETIRTWIDQGADWPDALSGDAEPPPPDTHASQIMEALRRGDRQSTLRLLRERPEAVNRFGPRGHTPLMYAVLYGDAGAVQLLLDRGADPNLVSAAKSSALMYAVDDAEKTRLLLDRGADPNARSDDGQTPLLIAVTGQTNASVVARLLLDRGANIRATSLTGGTVLTAAVSSRDPRLVELLLERGAERTPLPLAAAVQNGCLRCVQLLIGFAGAGELAAALTAAVRAEDEATARMLLDRGARADANLASTLAQIPQLPPADLVRALLDSGADIHATTRLGGNVLDLARRQGETKFAEILVSAGAKPDISAGRPEMKPSPAASVRQAIERSIPPLQRADEAFLRKAGCVSCHNNSLAPLAMAAARKSKLPVNERISRSQLQQVAAFMASNGERALQGLGIPGGIDTVGYVLLGMSAENYPSDITTDIWVRFLRNAQETDGHWRVRALRPPIEASDFQVTAAAMRALQVYAPPSKREEYQRSVRLAARWIETAQPRTTEDRAFQLLGLKWSAAGNEVIRKAAAAMIAEQRPDGGWGQLPTLASDAYATGQTLFALAESGALNPTSSAYQKGVQFLLKTQLADGSWYVQTRTLPVQRHFDSEFPHGTDQFISAAATNWAVMALAPALRN